MINFNESNRIDLGASGNNPYICSSYCILNDRIILSLYEPVSKKGKIAAYSIDSNGTLIEVASSEVYPSGPYNIAHTDGIFTNGTYIFQCLTTTEVSGNKYTLVWGFSDDAFIYPTVITNLIHGSHQGMAFVAGSDYIYTYSTENHPSPNQLVLYTFSGSAWIYIASSNKFTPGFPLFTIYNRVMGVMYPDEYGQNYYDTFSGVYDPKYGIQTNNYYGGYAANRPWLIDSIYWSLMNNEVKYYDYSSDWYYSSHTFEPLLPEGRAYHSSEDNTFSICAENGLYVYQAEGPYKFFGLYEPTKIFYFHFKLEKFDIILDNDLVGGRYQMKSGRFVYSPNIAVKFYARHTRGNNPLPVLFVDTSE